MHLSVIPKANREHRLPFAVITGSELALHAHADLSRLGLGGSFSLDQLEDDALQPREDFAA